MLRVRTGYSFRTAVGRIDKVMARLVEAGAGVAPISDRASTFGFVRWRKAAAGCGLRPVFGVELAVTDSLNARKSAKDYWTFWARDDLKWINRLVELATSQFHYEPLLTYEQACAAEGVVKVTGHRPRFELMGSGPREGLFVGLSPAVSRGMYNQARALGYTFCAQSENFYPRIEDKALYEVLVGRGSTSQTYPQHILSEEEWNTSLAFTDEATRRVALGNSRDVLTECRATIRQGVLLKPEKKKTLRELCEEGAQAVGCDLGRAEYGQRLTRELELIAEKEFEDYFFIIADLMQWARSEMLCGPARGSSCGSLVCYLLRITTIDPLPYGLIFERFIDTTREELPDIDLDFPEDKRARVFEYMEKKYGRERVARLGTVAMYKPRSAIAEAGAALDIPRWKTDRVLEGIVERSSGDSRALQVMEDTFNDTEAGRELIREFPEIRIAQEMEGCPRHASSHAAGLVLTEGAVTEYVALDARTGATQCDKKDAESLELLKIDALGLTQLSVFEDALALAGLRFDALEKVGFEDPAAFAVLNRGAFAGVFQYNGVALQSIANQIETRTLEDIIATTALARPGPMASGGTNEWVRRKRGDVPVEYPHELLRPYLEQSAGIIIYQEQVMDICRQVGGLSWGDVNALRRAMSKSLGVEFFNQYGDAFKKEAHSKGIPAESLSKIWDDLCSYGAMGFNKAHAAAYGIISYWCCWLKAHHPFEFAAATLQHETDPAKQIQLLREMDAEGIRYVPVDALRSTDRWQAARVDGEKVLIGPVQNVKGIGPKLVAQIVSARARGESLGGRAAKLLAGARTDIDSLWPVRDAFERLLPVPAERGIVSVPTPIIRVQCRRVDYDAVIFARVKQIRPLNENEPAKVAKRGYRMNEPTAALNVWFNDDTDVIYCKVGRFDFERLGRAIVERGRAGKALYAIRGTVPSGFRMLRVNAVRYIGDLDE